MSDFSNIKKNINDVKEFIKELSDDFGKLFVALCGILAVIGPTTLGMTIRTAVAEKFEHSPNQILKSLADFAKPQVLKSDWIQLLSPKSWLIGAAVVAPVIWGGLKINDKIWDINHKSSGDRFQNDNKKLGAIQSTPSPYNTNQTFQINTPQITSSATPTSGAFRI